MSFEEEPSTHRDTKGYEVDREVDKERVRRVLRELCRSLGNAGITLDCAQVTTLDAACCRAINDLIDAEVAGDRSNGASDEVIASCLGIR